MEIKSRISEILIAGTLTLGMVGCKTATNPNYHLFESEILSDWQVERAREYNSRGREFKNCDKNGDGMLDSQEAECYTSQPIFNYRFL